MHISSRKAFKIKTKQIKIETKSKYTMQVIQLGRNTTFIWLQLQQKQEFEINCQMRIDCGQTQ